MSSTENPTEAALADSQTQAMDPADPVYQDWIRERDEREIEVAGELLSSWLPAEPAPEDQGIGQVPGGETPLPRPGGGVRPAPPLKSFYSYRSRRPNVDWNTCGQAAIVSMVHFYGKDLGIPKTESHWEQGQAVKHWDHGQAIDRVKAVGFGPDVVFGWGTTPGRIRNALNHFGIPAQAKSSGLFFSGWPALWNRLLAYVYYSAIPVPVIVDVGVLAGYDFVADWDILWKMERSGSGMRIRLGKVGEVSAERFLKAWACRPLPLGFNHAAIYTGKPRISF